ncbi:IS3 family transposase [Clostridium saccharobutylicum]|nr:IS3 family transposase [Clostridium saccharobutylicum]MBC2415061.1 IS3 family transposase [Clostridium saccharobutylicum]MBC2443056.1 IS3 family transposase [Clostridium saccharobutylicum]MBC2447243.1 IS3 family transposase [Clostridium saccharobutylicum]MBC2451440.1 IS3 family transposase [Clostridium saccharobutylicum]
MDLKICTTFYELESTINNYMDYYNNYYRYQWEIKKPVPVQYRDQLLAT